MKEMTQFPQQLPFSFPIPLAHILFLPSPPAMSNLIYRGCGQICWQLQFLGRCFRWGSLEHWGRGGEGRRRRKAAAVWRSGGSGSTFDVPVPHVTAAPLRGGSWAAAAPAEHGRAAASAAAAAAAPPPAVRVCACVWWAIAASLRPLPADTHRAGRARSSRSSRGAAASAQWPWPRR